MKTQQHLTEVWGFLNGQLNPDLSKQKLIYLRQLLQIATVDFSENIISFTTSSRITVRLFHDGTIILERDSTSVAQDVKVMQMYFESRFSRAYNYLFSKGVPVSRDLKFIRSLAPFYLLVEKGAEEEAKELLEAYKDSLVSVESFNNATIYKGQKFAVVVGKVEDFDSIVGAYSFTRDVQREFSKYTKLHREIWEHIGDTSVASVRPEVRQRAIVGNGRIKQLGMYLQDPMWNVDVQNLSEQYIYLEQLWDMTIEQLRALSDDLCIRFQKRNSLFVQVLQILTNCAIVVGILLLLRGQNMASKISLYTLSLVLVLWVIYLPVKYFIDKKNP